jgi:LuxR family maltose regulon positive regulatory protein
VHHPGRAQGEASSPCRCEFRQRQASYLRFGPVCTAIDACSADDQSQAAAVLDAALVAAEPQRLRRPFLDEAPAIRPPLSSVLRLGTMVPQFAVDLLDRMSGNGTASDGSHRSPVVVPLTEREGLMLRYLASTLSDSDISRELYISMNTVKTHQRMIYRKPAFPCCDHARMGPRAPQRA